MTRMLERREVLRAGVTAAGLALLGIPEWALPAPAQGETAVPFTDIPANFSPGNVNAPVTLYDIRRIDGLITPADEFFSIAHYGVQQVDPAAYRLEVSGLLDRPGALSLDQIRTRPAVELIAGYECSGNSGRNVHGLVSNGRWTGARLRDLLQELGVRPEAREVVFRGADRGEEEVVFRNNTFTLAAPFARSMSLEHALRPEPLLAYALNGEPLAPRQGAPLRLIVPGWYGVANVKWLTGIHVQQDRFVGHYQARWYRTVREEAIGGEMQWNETEVTRLRLKSVIARVDRTAGGHRVLGFVLNDGAPLEAVEVRVDDGPWRRAAFDPANTQYSWKLFTWDWPDATPGEHTLVSRAIDAGGAAQPTEEDLATKRTFLEHNAQAPRTVMI